MEVKINREIREYTESIFFGLTLRQFICSFISCVLSVAIYLSTQKPLGNEVASWLCIIVVLPIAMIGFVKYNGMNAEQIIFAFIKSEILTSNYLVFNATNYYLQLIKGDR